MRFNRTLCATVLACAIVTGRSGPAAAARPEPAAACRVVHLEELWRVGGEEDDENLFGVVAGALSDADGQVYLLDTQLAEVRVFDAKGEFRGALGREGDGPGEWRHPRDIVWLEDGALGLVQGFPGAIVAVDRDGDPAGRVTPGMEGGYLAIRRARAGGGRVILAVAEITRQEDGRQVTTNTILSLGAAGEPAERYHSAVFVRDPGRHGRDETSRYFPDTWCVGADGRVWIAPRRNAYHVDVYHPDGTRERTITRDYESYRRSEAERAAVRAWLTPTRAGGLGAMEVTVAPTEPDILQMRVDEAGGLWILTSRGARPGSEGVHSVWDVFDPQGRFVHRAAVVCEGVGSEDRLMFPGNGLAVLVRRFADARRSLAGAATGAGGDEGAGAPVEVVCYRIP